MTLLEICEPVFGEVCDFNRMAAICPPGYDLHTELKARLAEAEQKAGADPLLASQFELVKRPLVYFIDDYVVTSPLFRGDDGGGQPHLLVASWQTRILEDELFSTVVGGRLFYKATEKDNEFDGLDETLKDRRPDAKDRLLVFRTCLGLGFGGMYRDQPAVIAAYMRQIEQSLSRLGFTENDDPNAEISPGAAKPIPPPSFMPRARWLRWVAAGFVILTVGVFVFSFMQFTEGTKEHANILREINQGH